MTIFFKIQNTEYRMQSTKYKNKIHVIDDHHLFQPWLLKSSWRLWCWRGMPPLHLAEIAHGNRLNFSFFRQLLKTVFQTNIGNHISDKSWQLYFKQILETVFQINLENCISGSYRECFSTSVQLGHPDFPLSPKVTVFVSMLTVFVSMLTLFVSMLILLSMVLVILWIEFYLLLIGLETGLSMIDCNFDCPLLLTCFSVVAH